MPSCCISSSLTAGYSLILPAFSESRWWWIHADSSTPCQSHVAFLFLACSDPPLFLVEPPLCDLVNQFICFPFVFLSLTFTMVLICSKSSGVFGSLLVQTSYQTLRLAYKRVSLDYLSRMSDRVIELKGPVSPHCQAVVSLLL